MSEDSAGTNGTGTNGTGTYGGGAGRDGRGFRPWGADWPPGRPVRVEGGIRARSKRGSIGEQWWSRRFIDVLESFGMAGRLARGRNYARRGQVLGFEISCGYVTAQVQGSRPKPYRVRIQVTPLTTPQWRRVEQALAAQALFRARLLAGEMPREIEEVFADCGTPLFPRSAGTWTCRAPARTGRCRASTWPRCATCWPRRFDDDPFGILAWRGRGREDLLGALRLTPAPPEAPRPLIDVTDRPLAECLADYWSPGMSAARLRALPQPTSPSPSRHRARPAAADVRAAAVPDPRHDLLTLLTPAYEQLAARRRADPA